MGSGEMTTELLEGRVQAHLASPASAAFIEQGNAESRARTGKPLVGETRNLVLSPVVIAMWKPMARPWAGAKSPSAGPKSRRWPSPRRAGPNTAFRSGDAFRFGHTHPEYSNSGLISLIAEVYAGAGKVKGLRWTT